MGVVAVVGNMAAGRGFSSKERSAEERIEAWTVGIQLLRERPLTGAGYGNFTDHNPLTAHNSFVLCFAELGLIGYFVWLGLIVLTYKGLSAVVERLPQDSEERKMAGLLRSALVGFLACAWFLSRTYAPGLYFALAMCVATWWVAKQSIPDAAVRTELTAVSWRRDTLVMMAITLVGVYGFIVMHRLSGA
jgi:putative inorganic carbon (hco3(-)) transporter